MTILKFDSCSRVWVQIWVFFPVHLSWYLNIVFQLLRIKHYRKLMLGLHRNRFFLAKTFFENVSIKCIASIHKTIKIICWWFVLTTLYQICLEVELFWKSINNAFSIMHFHWSDFKLHQAFDNVWTYNAFLKQFWYFLKTFLKVCLTDHKNT